MPRHVGNSSAVHKFTGQESPAAEAGLTLSDGNHPLYKLQHARFAFNQISVEPAQFVILAVPVVIAALGLQHLVTGENHRNP